MVVSTAKLLEEAREAPRAHALWLTSAASGSSPLPATRPAREHAFSWMAFLMQGDFRPAASGDDNWLEREEARLLPAESALLPEREEARVLPAESALLREPEDDDSRSQL